MSLAGKTFFITGASRGIGLAIARRVARDGANVAVVAKTEQPHPKLPGTIYTAAAEIEAAGGRALPLAVDIRDDARVEEAARRCAEHFGGIDVLVNNASAISLTGTLATPMKRFDLMFDVNVRGTFCCSRACLPYLQSSARAGRNPHILALAPPLDLDPRWFGRHLAYTMSKYGMSMCVIGLAEELRSEGIAVNGLWPRTLIDTAALTLLPGIDPALGRKPEILADAAWFIFRRDPRAHTGNLYLDEEVLAAEGITDLDRYAVVPGTRSFAPDLFVR